MSSVKINFDKVCATIKPMHGVNGGPVSVRGLSTDKLFSCAKIPFSRIHDSSLIRAYGGEHIVDVQNIFRDFDKDENNPNNYDFTLTDIYLKKIISCGTQVFYRLGSSIEIEAKKYGVVEPKDYNKYARICEHIIMHYNYGWADGFNMDIKYWEVWNEPDGGMPFWTGTEEKFVEFFTVVAGHLKEKFPQLKIGGPAVASPTSALWDKLLPYLKEHNVKLDFYSYHAYRVSPNDHKNDVPYIEELLKKYGLPRTEIINNEWNFAIGWEGDLWIESVNSIISQKGASYALATMSVLQNTSLDALMYYDASPSIYNGLYDFYTFKPLKTYYVFEEFGKLFELKNQLVVDCDDDDLFVLSAKNENKSLTTLTYYNYDNSKGNKKISVKFEKGYKDKEVRLIRDSNNPQLIFTTNENEIELQLNNFDIVFIECNK